MGAGPSLTDPARERAARALRGARDGHGVLDSHGVRDSHDAPAPAQSPRSPTGRAGMLLALQRRAGNAAVSALVAGKGRAEGAAAERMDAALVELRGHDPAIDVVETGLREAKQAGVPVDLEGTPPPASALAVTLTGFGPAAVPPKKPAPPPKPVPKAPAIGTAAARKPSGAGRSGKGGTGGRGGLGSSTGVAPGGAGAAAAAGAMGRIGGGGAALAPDQLLAPPVPPVGIRPEQDPAFAAVTRGVAGAAATARAHGQPAAKAKEAQDAALPPAGDLAAQAEAAKIEQVDAQQPGEFDKKAFIAAVKAAIEAKSPRSLEEADEYRESGRAGEVRGEVSELVSQGTGEQARDIETATAAPPDQSRAVPKEVVPMTAEPVGQVPGVAAAGAVPKPAPAEQTNLQAGKHRADAELADADVTEEQLERSNEPDFQQAVADKREAAQHADTAPGEFRQQEQQVLEGDRAAATAGVGQAVSGMQSTRAGAVAGLVADKAGAKEQDEGTRGQVATKIDAIYLAAEQDVKGILDGIDPAVDKTFGDGEAAARAAFESYVDAKMSAYKRDRYGGWLGGLKWAKDKLLGMPPKVNEFYAAGRELYLKKMDGVISRVADHVGAELTRAKKRIAAGRAEIAAFVKSLPADLRQQGAAAAQQVGDRFGALEGEVAAKQEAAVDSLASKYVESRTALDSRIEELQAANQGLVDKAIGAIQGVLNTIRELAAMLTNVLARAAGVVGQIIKDPIGFLGNLIAGVKGGILKFRDNIVEHLRKGLMSWLFGALAEGGIELPETFDIKGVVKLLASLFGLTWATIRNRIVRRIGARAMAAAERGVALFQLLATEGVGGLWEMLLEKLGDIKEMILEQVKDFVITKIIVAGITWLIGLLNPAAAFIKACKLIYDIVMFFVNNAARIMRFVNTVIDSVADVVRGNIGGVVNKINDVLGQMVPLIIGFFASAIGLGGIGVKIRKIVTALQRPFIRAVDFVIDKGIRVAGPLIRGLTGLGRGARDRMTSAGRRVRGQVQGVVDRVKQALVGKVGRRRPIPMRGTTHHLSVATVGGRPRLMVASTPAALLARLDRAAATETARTNTSIARKIRRARETVTLAQAAFDHAWAISDGPAIRATEARLENAVAQVEQAMIQLGREFDIDDLTGGTYVLDNQVHPDFRRKERRTFYGPPTYRRHLAAKRKEAFAAKLARYPDPTLHPDKFWCPGVASLNRYPHLAPIAGGMALDHKVAVATHWRTGAGGSAPGSNSTQEAREQWYSDPDNLEVLCRPCNSAKGSGGDVFGPAVGPEFSGPGGLR